MIERHLRLRRIPLHDAGVGLLGDSLRIRQELDAVLAGELAGQAVLDPALILDVDRQLVVELVDDVPRDTDGFRS